VKSSRRLLSGLIAVLTVLALWLVPVQADAATKPVAKKVSPSVVATVGGTSVTITGKNLKKVSAVYFGKTKTTRITHVSSTKLLVIAPKHAVGKAKVTLQIGKKKYSTKVTVSYAVLPVPALSAIAPDSGSITGDTEVTLTGVNLAAVTKVTFGGRSATISSRTETTLVVKTPAWIGGAATVSVINPYGTATTTYTYTSYNREATTDEAEVLRLTNLARATARDCGTTHFAAAPALTWNGVLGAAALAHSKDMIAADYFAHETVTTPLSISFSNRITRDGYQWSSIGENIAGGQQTPADVVKAWLSSPGHCQNLMSTSFTEIGVGKATGGKFGIYWVQDFGKPRS
jgi:uncharacterized protein YkwD